MTNIDALFLTELNSLKNLVKDPNIVVSKLDKGNGAVILNTSDDEEKMLKMIKRSHHKISKTNPLLTKSAITNKNSQQIYPTSAATPIMYGLPKVGLHKDGTPLS